MKVKQRKPDFLIRLGDRDFIERGMLRCGFDQSGHLVHVQTSFLIIGRQERDFPGITDHLSD